MKPLFLLIGWLFTTPALWAQFGLNAGYRINDAAQWKLINVLTDRVEAELLGNGPSVGIDYWLRLKNYRVEFLPELNYSRFNQLANNELELNADVFSFFLNTNVYFLDLTGDCDCPTFSKEGTIVDKGLFVQLSPGLSYMDTRLQAGEQTPTGNILAFSLGAGLGLDIGLSDLLTITPLAGFRYYPQATWEGLSDATGGIKELEVPDEQSRITQLYFALRFGFRLDES